MFDCGWLPGGTLLLRTCSFGSAEILSVQTYLWLFKLAFQIVEVHVFVTQPFGSAQTYPINNGGVVQFVRQHRIIRTQQDLTQEYRNFCCHFTLMTFFRLVFRFSAPDGGVWTGGTSNSPALASKQLAYRMQSSLWWNSASFRSKFLWMSCNQMSDLNASIVRSAAMHPHTSSCSSVHIYAKSLKSQWYLSAADKPDRAQSSTVWMESVNACLHNLRMTGESQVVVGTEVQYACKRDREAHVMGLQSLKQMSVLF